MTDGIRLSALPALSTLADIGKLAGVGPGAGLFPATALRSYAQLGRTPNLIDYGIAPGDTDAVNSALTTASATYGLLDLARASYTISGSPPALRNFALRGQAATFSGGLPDCITDGGALGVSNLWTAATFNRAGDSEPGSANQHLDFLSVYSAPSASPAAYEKTGCYIRVLQGDTSAGAIQRDLVAQQLMGYMAPGVTEGRLWGQHIYVDAMASSNGLVIGQEIEVYDHSGVVQGAVDTTTTKYGIHMVAAAGTPTIGLMFRGKVGDAKWGTGIYAQASGLDTAFLRIDNAFIVNKAGQIGVGTVALSAEAGFTQFSSANARVILETNNGTKSAFDTYKVTGVRAYSAGVDAATLEYRLSAVEGLASALVVRATPTQIGFLGAVPYVSGGWVAPTGGRSKASFDPSTVTLPTLAAFVASLYDALASSGYGFLRP